MRKLDSHNANPVQMGIRLRRERKRLNMSQKRFSEAGEVSIPTLSLYESGHRHPSLDFLIRLNHAGADVTYILSGEADPEARGVDLNELVCEFSDLLNSMHTNESRLEAALESVKADIRKLESLQSVLKSLT